MEKQKYKLFWIVIVPAKQTGIPTAIQVIYANTEKEALSMALDELCYRTELEEIEIEHHYIAQHGVGGFIIHIDPKAKETILYKNGEKLMRLDSAASYYEDDDIALDIEPSMLN